MLCKYKFFEAQFVLVIMQKDLSRTVISIIIVKLNKALLAK